MDTLPPNILKKVSLDFSPQDLSRCCAVSREWRDTFNKDWLWEPHCDPALVEPLDTTPCVVEPGFVSPENESSTLTPICRWRLAFLKQQHLWKNWKQGKCKEEEILKLDNEFEREFLTDTLLVRWCSDGVEVWDVSVIPATFVARTNLEGADYISAFGTHGLVVKHKGGVKVFHVDPSKKPVIEMKHEIPLGNLESCNHFSLENENLIKGRIYVHVNNGNLSMDVIDLENGTKQREHCPDVRCIVDDKADIHEIRGSPTSDHVIVIVFVSWEYECYHCYIYSLQQLKFLPGPVYKFQSGIPYCAIHGDYLAAGCNLLLTVCNVNTSESLFTVNLSGTVEPHTFNDSFIFTEFDDGKGRLAMLSLENKSVSTIVRHRGIVDSFSLTITNNKFVTVWGTYGIDRSAETGEFDNKHRYTVGVWEASGQTLKRSDIPAIHQSWWVCVHRGISQAFVRGVDEIDDDSHVGLRVYHYW